MHAMKSPIRLNESRTLLYPTPAGPLVCTLTLTLASRCNGSIPHVHNRAQATAYVHWSLDGVHLLRERLATVGPELLWWRSHGSACPSRFTAAVLASLAWQAPLDYLDDYQVPPLVMALLRGKPCTLAERSACTRARRKLRLVGKAATF